MYTNDLVVCNKLFCVLMYVVVLLTLCTIIALTIIYRLSIREPTNVVVPNFNVYLQLSSPKNGSSKPAPRRNQESDSKHRVAPSTSDCDRERETIAEAVAQIYIWAQRQVSDRSEHRPRPPLQLGLVRQPASTADYSSEATAWIARPLAVPRISKPSTRMNAAIGKST
jgi:hypothetical protein